MNLPRVVGGVLVALAVATSALATTPNVAFAQMEMPSVRVTKKICDNTTFPVFVESHCYEDDGASFDIISPNGWTVKTLRSGNQFKPTLEHFSQGEMWRIIDSNESSYAPVTVLSCLHHRPGQDLMLGVAPTLNLRDLQRWDLIWNVAYTGDGVSYAPSLECIWFELPNLTQMPAVLSLQAFTSSSPYMFWTDAQHTGLGEFLRGESGENLEANMVMSNITTGDVYSFAADEYGQVLVPEGQYILQNTDTGYQGNVLMQRGWTLLIEIGLGGLW